MSESFTGQIFQRHLIMIVQRYKDDLHLLLSVFIHDCYQQEMPLNMLVANSIIP